MAEVSSAGGMGGVLISLAELDERFDLQVTGIIHAGAHLGEEATAYRKLGVEKVLWIEADPRTYKRLCHAIKRYPLHVAVNAVVSDDEGQEVVFHVANNGESSSLLDLGTHAKEHPEVHYVDKFFATTTTLDQIAYENDWWESNFLNLDLQGAELMALRGAEELLNAHIDYVYTEVNVKQLYRGCALMKQIDQHLAPFGLFRRATSLTPHGWGDAFYLRPEGPLHA